MQALAASPSNSSHSPEYLILRISCSNGQSRLYASIYRWPKGLLFYDFVNDFSRFSHAIENIILSGDLNCNLLADNFEARHLRDVIFSSSLFLVQSAATFHTATADSWSDVIIIDNEDKLCKLSFHGKYPFA